MYTKMKRFGNRYGVIALLLLVSSFLILLSAHLHATLTPADDYQVEDVQVNEDYGISRSAVYELEQKSDIVGFEQGKHGSADYSVVPSFTEAAAEEEAVHTGAKTWMRYGKK